jgi:hypothetical protein
MHIRKSSAYIVMVNGDVFSRSAVGRRPSEQRATSNVTGGELLSPLDPSQLHSSPLNPTSTSTFTTRRPASQRFLSKHFHFYLYILCRFV